MFERYHPEEWAYKRYLNSPIFRQLARGLGDDYLSFLQAAEQELIGTPFPPTGKMVFDAFEAWERGMVDTDVAYLYRIAVSDVGFPSDISNSNSNTTKQEQTEECVDVFHCLAEDLVEKLGKSMF